MPHTWSPGACTTAEAIAPQAETEGSIHKSLSRRRSSLLKKIFRRSYGDTVEPNFISREALRSFSSGTVLDPSLAPAPLVPTDGNLPRRPNPSLPSPQTISRQQSEQRERLFEVPSNPAHKRAMSVDRRHDGTSSTNSIRRTQLPIPTAIASSIEATKPFPTDSRQSSATNLARIGSDDKTYHEDPIEYPPLDFHPDLSEDGHNDADEEYDEQRRQERIDLEDECDRKWILNLSMQFRDRSNREKFFVTYAETPTHWRRVTVSLDYRQCRDDSLEADLSTITSQREKSFRIYDAIRESLPEIQFYDTVTNLKLETDDADGQLHVHVHEDANEIVTYPELSLFDHISCPRFNENSLQFDSHLSGFVYKVALNGRTVIKKEIPGPSNIDEFLYEVNALDSLRGAENVVQLVGLVTDVHGAHVKGLLIVYAEEGPLVDMIYDFRGKPELHWPRREKWARQIVLGLANVHEAGYVQGDFTLSNIVIDDHDDAYIIDINRRGCPVGWEPPELMSLIKSGQRVSMHIGVKTDLYQLGMVLWALAEQEDEPENVKSLSELSPGIPSYYRQIVNTCLSERPQARSSAKDLLAQFPDDARRSSCCSARVAELPRSVSHSHRSSREYIDPKMAVTIEDVKERRPAAHFDSEHVEYFEPYSTSASTRYADSEHWRSRSQLRSPSSATSLSGISVAPGRVLARHYDDDEGIGCGEEDDLLADIHRAVTSLHQGVPATATKHDGELEESVIPGDDTPRPETNHSDVLPQTPPDDVVRQRNDTSTEAGQNTYAVPGHGLVGAAVTSVKRPMAELLHIDSGFDEIMDEPLNNGHRRHSDADLSTWKRLTPQTTGVAQAKETLQ